jgi:hypothetical protein
MTAIRNVFENRGVQLRAPVDERHLSQFEQQTAVRLHPFFRHVYLEFDGFASCDDKNQIFLWPLGRILENRGLSQRFEQGEYFAIGDFLIDSDFVMCSLVKEAAPVIFLYEKRTLAPTASVFFRRLASGDFDFL